MSSHSERTEICVKPNIHHTRGGYVLGFAVFCVREKAIEKPNFPLKLNRIWLLPAQPNLQC